MLFVHGTDRPSFPLRRSWIFGPPLIPDFTIPTWIQVLVSPERLITNGNKLYIRLHNGDVSLFFRHHRPTVGRLRHVLFTGSTSLNSKSIPTKYDFRKRPLALFRTTGEQDPVCSPGINPRTFSGRTQNSIFSYAESVRTLAVVPFE